MKTTTRQLFLGMAVACFFTLTLAAFAEDEKKTPPPPAAAPAPAAPAAAEPPPAPVADTPAPAAAVAPANVEQPAAASADEKKEPALRRLDEPPSTKSRPSRAPRVRLNRGSGNERIAIANDARLGPGEKADAVVAIAGSATSEGEVGDAVVSIMGNSTVTGGSVGDAVVSVMGNTFVNTKIGGEAVAVMGDVELGPNAEIGGDVVSVGGTVKRDPAAIVHGNVQNVSLAGKMPHFGGGLQTWFRECLLLGRPLAFNPKLAWAWGLTLGFFTLYVLLALLFGGAVEKCAQTLEGRPGGSILAALLTLLLTPVLIVLLCITVVGIAVVPFLVLALMIAALFGKAVMLAWVGRRITKFFGPGPLRHAAMATFIGGAIVLLLYTVPFLGLTVQKSFDVLGLGVVVYTLMLGSKREKTATTVPPPVMPTAPGGAGLAAGGGESAAAMAPGFGEPGASAALSPGATPLAAPLPPAVSAATLPRAGFWIRAGALALDGILLAVIVAMMHVGPKYLLLALAIYGAVMWKLRGTTIGGVVCGLKVVRVDGRELDWATAIVRALGCFLSLVVAGLGFIWVAIDDDKQSWHDKIAGTTVVLVPKGASLV